MFCFIYHDGISIESTSRMESVANYGRCNDKIAIFMISLFSKYAG